MRPALIPEPEPELESKPESLFVWDASERATCGSVYWSRVAEIEEWIKEQGSPFPKGVFRAEFYYIDIPFAITTSYALDERSRKQWNGNGPQIAEPQIVMLPGGLPPEQLGRPRCSYGKCSFEVIVAPDRPICLQEDDSETSETSETS